MSQKAVEMLKPYIASVLEAYLRELEELGLTRDDILFSEKVDDLMFVILQKMAGAELGLTRLGIVPSCADVEGWLMGKTDEEKLQIARRVLEELIEELRKERRLVEEVKKTVYVTR